MPATAALLPTERIQGRIVVLRGMRVLLDADLAELYDVPTKRLNEQVKRNLQKFPEDFMFKLTKEEAEAVQRSRSQGVTLNKDRSQTAAGSDSKSQTATSNEGKASRSQSATLNANRSQSVTGSRGKNIKYLPYAFTEHGAIQAANVLNSPAATEMSVQVVRAFVGLRQLMVNHKALASKLAELDARVGAHDGQLAALVQAIRDLAQPATSSSRRKIGFHPGNR